MKTSKENKAFQKRTLVGLATTLMATAGLVSINTPQVAANIAVPTVGDLAEIPSTATAQQILPAVVAYASADKPKASRYSPSALNSYSVFGGEIVAQRHAQGRYEIAFDGADFDDSQVQMQVTAIRSNARCSVQQHSASSAQVECFNTRGLATDSAYSISVVQADKASRANVVAYAFAGKPQSTDTYTAPRNNSFNEAGLLPRIDRRKKGLYMVQFPGVDVASTNIQASGFQGAVYCNASSWSGSKVGVACFNTEGKLTNAKFTVALVQKSESEQTNAANTVAFAVTDENANKAGIQEAYNSTGGEILTRRLSEGHYRVTFAGLSQERKWHIGSTLLSSNMADNTCVVNSFGYEQVDVSCFDSKGQATDSGYSLQFIKRS